MSPYLTSCIGPGVLQTFSTCAVKHKMMLKLKCFGCLTSSNPSAQVFIDAVRDLFMLQHIVKPTRYRGEDTPNVLNLKFTDDENMVDNLSYLPG